MWSMAGLMDNTRRLTKRHRKEVRIIEYSQWVVEAIQGIWNTSGIISMDWRNYVMIAIACILIYLAIGRQFEPLLLLPISFGMLLVNLMPGIMAAPTDTSNGGLFYYLYQGVKLGIYPPLIFLGIGAMTDFGPLIANPKSFLLGAAAQLGIFLTFILAILVGFDVKAAGAIGIIGGADGPTAIFVTSKLKPELLGPIAVAAYSYMALVPIIQPPIMKLLTTKKERAVVMEQLRSGFQAGKNNCSPLIITIVVALLLPDAVPLVGMLMLGKYFPLRAAWSAEFPIPPRTN